MDAYAAAINAVVKPADVVLDLGCGLGVLAFLAVKAGASRVYAIEYDAATLKMAKAFAAQNNLEQKIKFIKGLSGKIKLPEKVDVIVSETFSNIAVNENILPNMLDARKRFLKRGGIIIPQNFNLYAVPVAFKPWQESLKCLGNVKGLNFAIDQLQDVDLQIRSEAILPKYFLSKPQKIASIDFYQNNAVQLQISADFTVTQAGSFCGFAMWFDTVLYQNVGLSTAPDKPATHWQQAFLPAAELITIKSQQKIRFYFESLPDAIPAGPLNHVAYGYEMLT